MKRLPERAQEVFVQQMLTSSDGLVLVSKLEPFKAREGIFLAALFIISVGGICMNFIDM